MGNRFLSFYLLIGSFALLQSCSVSNQIAKQANAILLQDSTISTGHAGISIYEPATNSYWYNYNADKYFVPASNTKLFTLYAGMKYLGDSLVGIRYKESKDSITIYPAADPTFLHPDYLKQPVFDLLVIKKHLGFCSQYFTDNLGKGWAWDDYQEGYMTQRNEFPLYGNLARIYISKDGYKIIPGVIPVNASSSMIEKYKDSADYSIYRQWDNNTVFLTFKSREPHLNNIITVPMVMDFNTVVELLADTLKSEINLFGKKITDSVENNDKRLNILYSQPTDSLLTPMMHRSDNFFGEQTLLMASNEHLGYMNDEAIIDSLLKNDLKDIPQKPTWVDGSGLSRYNLFTPQSFIYILNKMKNEFGLERLKKILPTGGEGTLKDYYINDSTFIYAKTGTLGGTIALSGFLITQKNKLLIFSVLTNNFKGRATAARRAVEKFIIGIRKKY